MPPVGAIIQARRYRTGGGLAGNVPAESISQLLSGVGGVESVSNPKAAEGGADAEALENLAWRGSQTLRHRGRSLAPADYETMAREASPAVAVARALPGLDPGGRERPGWVTLIIIPNSAEDRPWPSFGLREHVRRYIAQRAPAAVAAAGGLYVTGPQYQPVDVSATIVPRDPTQ
ncbi:MAG: putative baseplate assembly protein, partial [Planctomycetales bacterium]|nr:putative baseplate assembly protein [Planctomycetales bacterium]